MDALRLRSSDSDASLEFSAVTADGFHVALVSHAYSARRPVYCPDGGSGIPLLFAAGAREWKGWIGDKAWNSVEGELELAMRVDRLGHVTLKVCLRSDGGAPDRWQLEAELALEAGQLDATAAAMAELWRTTS